MEANKKEAQGNEVNKKYVDFNDLGDLNFGPNWSNPETSVKQLQLSEKSLEKKAFRKGGGERKDRRSFSKNTERKKASFEFKPVVDVQFYPEDEPFLKLTKAIRSSKKTYELFEVAMAILEKPERFVAVIRPFTKKDSTENTKLFVSPSENIPFLKEEEAIAYSLKHCRDYFFTIESIDIDPPKGSFLFVNKCGVTGKLLGPPNYHRYQQLVQEHYENNIHNMSFERFEAGIESVKDPEQINNWLEEMKKTFQYTLKANKASTREDDAQKAVTFDKWEDARAYLLTHHKKELVKEQDNVRVRGVQLENLPKGDMERSIRVALENQRKFPLDTANNLRGRMRRMHFSIYKKRAKGVSYVCAVKRKFRDEKTVLAEELQKLLEIIEKDPDCTIKNISSKYLNISKDDEVNLSEEDKKAVRQVMLNLRWLVCEGYVTEYGNGSLYVPPVNAKDEESASSQEEALSENKATE